MTSYRFEPDPEARLALVSSPFAGAETPSLQLGILAAILRRDGIPTDVVYLNLLFAELCHPLIYREAWEKAGQFVEGVFSPVLHPGSAREGIVERLKREPLASKLALQWMELAAANVEAFMDECLKRVPWGRYSLVGFTTSLNQLVPSLAISRVLKERRPELVTIFGGGHCEGEMGEALLESFPWVDYVYRGEAEGDITRVVSALLDGGGAADVPGLIGRGPSGGRDGEEVREPFSAWGSIPAPDFSDYFEQLAATTIAGELQVKLPFEGSRGCWWGVKRQCTFCGTSRRGITFRRKDDETLLSELALQAGRYGARFFDAVDDALDVAAFDSLVPRLTEMRKEMRVSFFFEVRCDLKRHQVVALKAVGADTVQPGIESFSTRVLKLMNKGVTGLQNVQFLKWLATFGIRSLWNILCGVPGEEDSDYMKMLELFPLLVHLEPPASFQTIELRRFSPYFTRPEEHGVQILGAGQTYKMLFDLEERKLARLAYSFEFSTTRSVISPEVQELVDQAVTLWQRRHKPRSLACRLEGEGVRIIDERPGMPGGEALLGPLEAAAYRLCDQAQRLGAVESRLGAEGGRAEGVLEGFVEKGWMIKDGGRYLALAVPAEEDAHRWPLELKRPEGKGLKP